jgi:hypothetical protein
VRIFCNVFTTIIGSVLFLAVTGMNPVLAFEDETAPLSIVYPQTATLFPGNIIPPIMRWVDQTQAGWWSVEIRKDNGFVLLEARSDEPWWRPDTDQWDALKKYPDTVFQLCVTGFAQSAQEKPLSRDSVQFTISAMTVNAPIFYRDVPLPARHARGNLPSIEWRLGSVADASPRTVLSGMTECGNCHSFSANGKVLGMDVDFGSDKGAYVLTEVNDHVLFDQSKVITWSDFNPEALEPTFGLLSTVSPDGRHVVSTVNDYAAFRYIDDLDYSQLFFPVRGILVAFDRETKRFHTVPGATDTAFVQTNPAISPDGKWLVFARAPALQNKEMHSMMHGFLYEDTTYQYDLYRVPFGQDQAGKPEPIPGASHNGMSNFFPKFSPDGKWIVFCKAKRFMLNQLDSELYIIPAQGGKARRLAGNFPGRMNSWHSWSPDGKWLVFASKANGPYTQLWLTHITEQGESTPPVLLDHLTGQERAANIPEFVNISFEEQLLRIVNELN